jgi:hypothetical protein
MVTVAVTDFPGAAILSENRKDIERVFSCSSWNWMENLLRLSIIVGRVVIVKVDRLIGGWIDKGSQWARDDSRIPPGR